MRGPGPKVTIPVNWTTHTTADGRRVSIMMTRRSGTYEMRLMADNAVRAGFASPLDVRLLVPLAPNLMHVLVADMEDLPPVAQVVDDADLPLTVLGLLSYPHADQDMFRVVFQVRLRDFLCLPPMVLSQYPDGAVGEEPGDALDYFGLTRDDDSPDLPTGFGPTSSVRISHTQDGPVPTFADGLHGIPDPRTRTTGGG